MARGHRLNTSILLAAVHGLSGLFRADSAVEPKLQALVYDILPSTTAVFSYAIGSRKLSANEQFFVGAQRVVILLQTTQIKQGVSFIAANKVYTSTNKTTIVFLPGVDASHVYVRALALGCFYSHISTRTFRRALNASLDSCAEIKREKHREERNTGEETETSQVKALFVFRPVAHYNEGWEEEEKMSNAEKSYTVRTDMETESEIWMYRRLFAFCNYSSFT